MEITLTESERHDVIERAAQKVADEKRYTATEAQRVFNISLHILKKHVTKTWEEGRSTPFYLGKSIRQYHESRTDLNLSNRT